VVLQRRARSREPARVGHRTPEQGRVGGGAERPAGISVLQHGGFASTIKVQLRIKAIPGSARAGLEAHVVGIESGQSAGMEFAREESR
jgi:hypothetical protein